jgi:hypothetical protein
MESSSGLLEFCALIHPQRSPLAAAGKVEFPVFPQRFGIALL